MWIVTRELNLYEQYGEYFVAAYTNKPTFQQLRALLPAECDETVGRLTRGGGRVGCEYEWFHLQEYRDGERLE